MRKEVQFGSGGTAASPHTTQSYLRISGVALIASPMNSRLFVLSMDRILGLSVGPTSEKTRLIHVTRNAASSSTGSKDTLCSNYCLRFFFFFLIVLQTRRLKAEPWNLLAPLLHDAGAACAIHTKRFPHSPHTVPATVPTQSPLGFTTHFARAC